MAGWNIPLEVGRGVTPLETPFQVQAGALGLKQMAQAQQIQKQVQAENALKIQAMQEDQNDQKFVQDAFHDQTNWSPNATGTLAPDFDKIRTSVAPKVRLKTLQALDLDHANVIKGLTQMQAEKRQALINKNTSIGNELLSLLQTPEAERPTAYAASRARLINTGDIHPDDPTYPEAGVPLDDQTLKSHLAQVGYAAQVAKLADEQAKRDLEKQQQARAAAAAAKTDVESKTKEIQQQLENAARDHLAVNDQTSHDAWLADLKENAPEAYKRVQNLKTFSQDTQGVIQNMALTADQRKKAEKAPPEKNPTEVSLAQASARAKAPDATPDEKAAGAIADAALKRLDASKVASRPVTNITLTPDQSKTTAEAIANGDYSPTTVRSTLRKNPGLLSDIKKIDPEFDEADLEKRYSTLKEFTSSSNTKAGGQVLALNTLIHHADLYLKTAEALKNGSFKPGNAIYNEVASAFGSAPPQNTALVAQFLAGETGKVATGGVPAEGEVKRVLSGLSTSSSPKQIQDAADTLLGIAAGRMLPLKEKRDDARLQKRVQIVGPDAKDILTRHGYDPETMKKMSQQGGGATHRIKIGNKFYDYKGSGDTADLKNYNEVKQ